MKSKNKTLEEITKDIGEYFFNIIMLGWNLDYDYGLKIVEIKRINERAKYEQ